MLLETLMRVLHAYLALFNAKFNTKGLNYHAELYRNKLANSFVVKQLRRGSTSLQIIVLKFAQVHYQRMKAHRLVNGTNGRDNYTGDDVNPRYDEKRRDRQVCVPREQRICEADDSSRHTYRRPTYTPTACTPV